MRVVPVGRGERVYARMPTVDERAEHDLPEGVPLLVVRRAGGVEEAYPADAVLLEAAGEG